MLVWIDIGFFDDLVCVLWVDVVNIMEGDCDFFFCGDFYIEEMWYIVFS